MTIILGQYSGYQLGIIPVPEYWTLVLYGPSDFNFWYGYYANLWHGNALEQLYTAQTPEGHLNLLHSGLPILTAQEIGEFKFQGFVENLFNSKLPEVVLSGQTDFGDQYILLKVAKEVAFKSEPGRLVQDLPANFHFLNSRADVDRLLAEKKRQNG